MYLTIQFFILFSFLIFYSLSEECLITTPSVPKCYCKCESSSSKIPSISSPQTTTCPPKNKFTDNQIVFENVNKIVEFGPCHGIGFFPQKSALIEVEMKGPGGFEFSFSTAAGNKLLTFKFDGIVQIGKAILFIKNSIPKFEIGLYSAPENWITTWVTNSDGKYWHYTYKSENDLSKAEMLVFEGNAKIEKVILKY